MSTCRGRARTRSSWRAGCSRCRRQLVAAAPDNDDVLELLINSEIRLGDTLEARGVLDEGLQHLLRARETLVKLADKDPSNGDRVRTLVYLQQRIGDLLRKKDDTPKALREYEGNLRARAVACRQAASQARLGACACAGASAHGRHSARWRRQHGRARTFPAYRDLMESLVKTELTNVPNWTWRLDLWIGHQRIGDILFVQKDYAGALAEYELYNKRAGEAARLDADNGEWQRFLANSHMMIGDVLLAQNWRRGRWRNTPRRS